jgi:hypothetical protein
VPTTGGTSAPVGGPAAPQAGPIATGGQVRSAGAVRVGVLYGKGVDKAAKAIGLSGLTTGDTAAQAKAVIDWINAHGGLAGRKIQPFYYGIQAGTGGDADAAYEAACTSLTQDSKVRFVITILNLRPNSMPCFRKGGAGVLGDQLGLGDTSFRQYAANMAAPGDFAPGRMLRNLVDDLWARGWLTPKSKIGAFTFEAPEYREQVTTGLAPALAAHGLKIAVTATVPNDSRAATAAGSVTIKFRAEGVDRVIPVAASPLFLMMASSSQGYRPAYAMFTSYGPGALIESAAPKDQLENSAGIGWQPLLDIGKGTKNGPVSPNETLCFQIMAKAGLSDSAATVKGFQLQTCNTLFYLQAAAAKSPAIGADFLSVTRPLIGSSFRPADTFRSDVTRRADGAAGFRSLAYQASCSCYQYVSPVKAAP